MASDTVPGRAGNDIWAAAEAILWMKILVFEVSI